MCDREGTVRLVISKPESPLFNEDFQFMPTKAVSDSVGNIYVLSYGCAMGLLKFAPDGTFMNFYGANPVVVTASVYMDFLWKRILSQEQRASMVRLLPVEYSGVSLGRDGFIYTSTVSSYTLTDQIKKLNPSGGNVLRRPSGSAKFGDHETDPNAGTLSQSSFVDVFSDKDSMIYALDSTNMRVFVYNADAALIGVFGGQGNQRGTFQQPVAVDSIGGKILVLDSMKNNLTIFRQTEYMALIREADSMYRNGYSEASLVPWERVTAMNQNNELAHIGVGKANFIQEEYLAAMAAYKSGAARPEYSKSYQQVRLSVFKQWTPVILIALGATVVLYSVLRKIGAVTRPQSAASRRRPAVEWRNPFICLMHPFNEFEALRYHGGHSYLYVLVIIVLWVIAATMSRQNTGFLFNYNNLDDFNFAVILGKTAGLYAVWTVACWTVTTFLNGTARFKDIVCVSAYALIPYILALFIAVALSNILLLTEGGYLGYILTVGVLLSGAELLIGLRQTQDMELLQTFWLMILTVLVMAVVLFLCGLLYTLLNQMVIFGYTIFREIIFRL